MEELLGEEGGSRTGELLLANLVTSSASLCGSGCEEFHV